MRFFRAALVGLMALVFASCSTGKVQVVRRYDQPDYPELFGPQLKTVRIEVDYAQGAEPYTEAVGTLGSPWELFAANAQRLFRAKTVEVPTTLDAMQPLGDVPGASFTVDQILDLADAHRDVKNGNGVASFYVIFLNGYYAENDAAENNVLGASIGNTGVIAVFKPVVSGAGDGPRRQTGDRYVEQSTLIHEFGHAIGLVDNGVALATTHEDAAHPKHCANSKCVLFWENDGAAAATQFVRSFLTSGNQVLFGPECLGDVDAFASKQGN